MTNEITTPVRFAEVTMHGNTRKAADRLASLLEAEYPALRLVPQAPENEDGKFRLVAWSVLHMGDATDEAEGTEVYHGDKLPSVAELLDACEDEGLDPEYTSEEEEPEASGSVVADEYRRLYKEASSNGQTCGDWLAERLVDDTHGADGFNPEDFTQILSNNGVDLSAKWAKLPYSGQKGWVGRYRMNGRQVLEKVIALRGIYVDGIGTEVTPPLGWLADTRAKHAKWLEKERKAIAAAEAAVRTATEA